MLVILLTKRDGVTVNFYIFKKGSFMLKVIFTSLVLLFGSAATVLSCDDYCVEQVVDYCPQQVQQVVAYDYYPQQVQLVSVHNDYYVPQQQVRVHVQRVVVPQKQVQKVIQVEKVIRVQKVQRVQKVVKRQVVRQRGMLLDRLLNMRALRSRSVERISVDVHH